MHPFTEASLCTSSPTRLGDRGAGHSVEESDGPKRGCGDGGKRGGPISRAGSRGDDDSDLKPAVQQYLAEELGLGREGAAKVVRRQPAVLGLSVEANINPKLAFISLHFANIFVYDALGLVCYSRIGRMVPRVNLLERYDMLGKWRAGTVLKSTNPKYCKMVGIHKDEYDCEVAACKEAHARDEKKKKSKKSKNKEGTRLT